MITPEERRLPFDNAARPLLLDLGCGNSKRLGSTGMDSQAQCNPDILHNVEVLPWPVESESFEAVIAWHLFEHLKPWLIIDIMNECWRVVRTGGLLYIAMPQPGSPDFYQDPTHVRTWNADTPKHFDPRCKKYEFYKPRPWDIEVNSTYTIKSLKKTALYFVFRKRAL